MTVLERRVRRLEARYGSRAPLPWQMPGWERLSETDQLLEGQRYVAMYPDSLLARKWRVIEALTDNELEALHAETRALLGEAL
jgi:hypothetical protein